MQHVAGLVYQPVDGHNAVAGCRVYRDGVLIATTTALSHHVSGLTSRTSYVFAVRAFDGQNNESAPSQVNVRTSAR